MEQRTYTERMMDRRVLAAEDQDLEFEQVWLKEKTSTELLKKYRKLSDWQGRLCKIVERRLSAFLEKHNLKKWNDDKTLLFFWLILKAVRHNMDMLDLIDVNGNGLQDYVVNETDAEYFVMQMLELLQLLPRRTLPVLNGLLNG